MRKPRKLTRTIEVDAVDLYDTETGLFLCTIVEAKPIEPLMEPVVEFKPHVLAGIDRTPASDTVVVTLQRFREMVGDAEAARLFPGLS